MTKAIKSPNRKFYRIDYICCMTGLFTQRLLLLTMLLLAVKLLQAQDIQESPCKQLRDGKRSEPLRMAYKMPEFPGGEEKMKKFITGNFKHSTARPKQGTVYIAAIIGADGTISSERVLKGINGEYNREALRVIRAMPKWTPGECEEGKKVAVEVLIKVKV